MGQSSAVQMAGRYNRSLKREKAFQGTLKCMTPLTATIQKPVQGSAADGSAADSVCWNKFKTAGTYRPLPHVCHYLKVLLRPQPQTHAGCRPQRRCWTAPTAGS